MDIICGAGVFSHKQTSGATEIMQILPGWIIRKLEWAVVF